MGEKLKQARPLSPAAHIFDLEKDDVLGHESKKHPHRKYVLCCGCATATILILLVILLVLIFTLFWTKTPRIKVNSVVIQGLDRVDWKNVSSDTNLTLLANVSVKNPNVASFKFQNATTGLYYDGNAIGEARTPPGNARALRTFKFNVTVNVMVKNILDVPRLQDDFLSGIMPLNSYTRIRGRATFLNIIKKTLLLKTDCTMKVNFTSYRIQERDCDRQVITT